MLSAVSAVCVRELLCMDVLYAVSASFCESERQRSAWVSGGGLASLYGFRWQRAAGMADKLIKCSHLGSSRAATQHLN